VQSQVEECQALIARTGWTLVADPYAYTEQHKSGYYRVERPVLDAVLQLAQRGEVDVIVAREMERVSRTKAGRYQGIGTAAKYGAEFRFANLPPDGKLPNTTEGKLYLAMLEEFGEMERDRIVERTAPGRERRLAAGIPGGGRFGPAYGYRWPDKNGAKTNGTFVEVEEESAIMRELYARISTGTSAREFARELHARGVPTPSGEGEWSASQIIRLIRNPIYCGRGRTKRWETVRTTVVNSETREVYDYATSRDRTRSDTYVEETYPIDPSRAPALVTPEVWDHANAALAAKKNFYGKLGRWNSPHPVEATLLHGGYVRCARCGSPMVRQWNAVAGAAGTVEMVETKLAVQRDLAAEIERARADHLAAIAALGALPGHEDMVAKLRAELVQLDRDADAAASAHARALPEQERAARRQRMLERLSRIRHQQTWVNDSAGTVTVMGDGERVLKKTLGLSVATDLLGMSEDEVRALGLHTVVGGEEGWVEEIKTEEVLYRLFKNAPHERLRQMVDDLGVRVYIAPPWTKEERALRGLTPLSERVTVQLLDPMEGVSVAMPGRHRIDADDPL
jgi:DNA invertase Pin-like site-specific DNA recombinase